jgi:protein involved in polysaccharide export with SLBB domain
VSSGLTLVQVISLAGGFSDMADRNGTTLSRRVDGELQRFRVPVDEITSGAAQMCRLARATSSTCRGACSDQTA